MDKIESKQPGLYKKCIPEEKTVKFLFNGIEKKGIYICSTCKSTMLNGKLPSMSICNGLQLANIREGCDLTELENNLIALNLNFQYIYFKPKSRWAATKNQMISVPITQETVQDTVEQLPRLPKDAGLIPVQLKKKKEYKAYHRKELINPEKVIRALQELKKSGHPYYQFLNDGLISYKSRCEAHDKPGYELLFPSEEASDEETIDETLQQPEQYDKNKTDVNEAENEEITRDAIKKYQFDHNNNTCLTHNYPEASVDQNGKQAISEEQLTFAPG